MAGFKHSSLLFFLYPSKIRFYSKNSVCACAFVCVHFSIIINKNAAADWKTTRMNITERYNKWKKKKIRKEGERRRVKKRRYTDRISHTKWNETEPISIYLTADSNVNSCFSEPVRWLLLLFLSLFSLFYLLWCSFFPLHLSIFPRCCFVAPRRFEFQYIEKCLNHPTFAIHIGYFCLCVNWMVCMSSFCLPRSACCSGTDALFCFFSLHPYVLWFFPFPFFAT